MTTPAGLGTSAGVAGAEVGHHETHPALRHRLVRVIVNGEISCETGSLDKAAPPFMTVQPTGDLATAIPSDWRVLKCDAGVAAASRDDAGRRWDRI